MKIPYLKPNLLLINALIAISTSNPHALVAQTDAGSAVLAYHQATERSFSRPVNARLNDIPVQAYRHFVRNFSQAAEESWSKQTSGYQVRFKSSGVLCQASYDRFGNFMYGVRFLEAGQIDGQILKKLKHEFPGYEPDIVSEINNESRTVYMITLKNQYSMKSVLFKEGSFQVIDDLEYAGR